jgi:hypothetical protein
MRGDAEQFAQQIGSFRRELAGMVRRMSVRFTGGGIWQLAGHLLFGSNREAREIELFPGIGIYARPPKGSTSAEAIVANAGGQNNPAVIATRDEAVRAKVNDIAEDETATYNTLARVYVKADGTIEARTHAGAAVALCKHSDMVSLKTQFANWIVVPNDGGGALKTLLTTLIGTGWPFGTTKLKGE